MSHRISRRSLGAAGVTFCYALAAAAAPAGNSPDAVAIDNFAFAPATLTVAPGAKVMWTNHDDEPHTIVAADDAKLFKSPALDTDETFSFVFDKPGAYHYFCSIHPHMQGTVVVR